MRIKLNPHVFIVLNLSIVVWVMGATAHAGAVCEGYRKDAPDLFALYCSEHGGGAKPAGATSTFSDSFKLNTANLPTEESPYGVEVLPTFLESGQGPGFPTISLIKGFHRFGTGLSTGASNTFYSNDVYERLNGPAKVQTLKDMEPAKGSFINLNLGTSFLLWDPSFGPAIQLGLSGRYNRITNTFGGGPALFLSGEVVSFGVGLSHEQTSNTFGAQNFVTYTASLRLSRFEFEADLLTLTSPPDARLQPIYLLTGTYTWKVFIFTAAVRTLNFLSEGNVVQPHAGIQVLLGKQFSLGYLFNYIPGGNTLGLQAFL